MSDRREARETPAAPSDAKRLPEGSVRYEVHRGSAVITVDRPAVRNAMTFAMYDALYSCCERADADDEIRVVLVRGAGEKAFIAGTDISEFRGISTAAQGLQYEARVERVIARLERVTKPTIAVVAGYAVGGGLAIAIACDLQVCTHDAKLGIPIARTVGNCLSIENYARLVHLVGPARTKEMVYTARLIDAEEALAIGLVTHIVERAALDDRVEALVSRIASHAPLTLRATKEALRRLRTVSLPPPDDLVGVCYASGDFRRGVDAFAHKREPVWEGT